MKYTNKLYNYEHVFMLSYYWSVILLINGQFLSDLKLNALFKVIRYIHRRPQQMTIGTIYAITLTEGESITIYIKKKVTYAYCQ